MEQSGGRSRVLCWELVGLVCFAGGDTSKQGKIKGNQGKIKGKQGKSREIKVKQGEIKVNQDKSRGVKGKTRENKRSQGDQCEPRKNEMK